MLAEALVGCAVAALGGGAALGGEESLAFGFVGGAVAAGGGYVVAVLACAAFGCAWHHGSPSAVGRVPYLALRLWRWAVTHAWWGGFPSGRAGRREACSRAHARCPCVNPCGSRGAVAAWRGK